MRSSFPKIKSILISFKVILVCEGRETSLNCCQDCGDCPEGEDGLGGGYYLQSHLAKRYEDPYGGGGGGGGEYYPPYEPPLPPYYCSYLYCGDGSCNVECGETVGSCCQDCGGCPCFCGDNFCDIACEEDALNCCTDCGGCPDCETEDCGNDFCNTDCENISNCCGDCGYQCGDSICSIPCETLSNCCLDCADFNNDVNNCGSCGNVCGLDKICSAATCICQSGFEDCTTYCADIETNINNCGACNAVCAPNNAVPACTNGVCGISSCLATFGNCDGNSFNGYETSLISLTNCVSCGTVCSRSNAASSCASGTCSISSCNGGFGNCDSNPANGCETPLNTLTDCNVCGTACSLSNAVSSCESGTCFISSCNAGWADCDGNPANGCETSLNTLTNCGTCGIVCSLFNTISSCASGTCQLSSCNAGWDNCDGNPSNGCETPLNTLTDCASCGTACSLNNAIPSCASGTCSLSSCNVGWGNCDGTQANGCETPLNTLTNCGSCASTCSLNNVISSCATGSCILSSCNTGWGNCDSNPANGCETPLNTNSNCASCGTSCIFNNALSSCASGSCVFQSCVDPFQDCNSNIGLDGCESNKNSDTNNCGNCGIVCTPCIIGACTIPTCTGGTADCDANGSCETDINNDINNCGSCGNVCSSNHGTASCSGGVCSIVCNAAFDNCNAGVTDAKPIFILY